MAEMQNQIDTLMYSGIAVNGVLALAVVSMWWRGRKFRS